MPKHDGTFIGLDFGTKYIGIAVGQTVTKTATPLTTVAFSSQATLWHSLSRIIQEWQPHGLVIGLALQPDGGDSPTSLKAKKFAEQCQSRFNLPIYFTEERLTSVAARQRLKDPSPFMYNQPDVDALAAAIILESWFNQQKETSSDASEPTI